MDYTDRPNRLCRYLPHGMVLSNNCQRNCEYFCFPPYESEGVASVVNCDVTSRKWLTSSGNTPCKKKVVASTTKKPFDLDFKYDDLFNMDDYKTFKPPDFDMNTFKVPTVKPYDFDDDDTFSSTSSGHTNSALVPGLAVTGLLVLTLLSVCTRLSFARIRTRRRQERIQRIQQFMGHVTSDTRTRTATPQPMTTAHNLTGSASREQRQPVDQPTRRSADDSEQGDNDAGMFIVIRRIFRIPLVRNPYNVLESPPSPPPYDAESVPPPAYEETEGQDGFSNDCRSQTNDVEFSECSEVPSDAPPPYTENV